MKAVMERIEYTWWNFQIRVMDESEFIQNLLPRFREVWDLRIEAAPYLAWSLLGFPLGIIIGLLTGVVS